LRREIAEKSVREEYTLDWSQSKVFLVDIIIVIIFNISILACKLKKYLAIKCMYKLPSPYF